MKHDFPSTVEIIKNNKEKGILKRKEEICYSKLTFKTPNTHIQKNTFKVYIT